MTISPSSVTKQDRNVNIYLHVELQNSGQMFYKKC